MWFSKSVHALPGREGDSREQPAKRLAPAHRGVPADTAGCLMERVLLITTENPFPADGGGRLRTRGILDTLASRFLVDLVTFERPSHPELDQARSRINIVQVPKTVSPRRAAVRSLYRMRAAGYMGHADVDMMGAAKDLCRTAQYRDVFVNNTKLGYFIAPLRKLQPHARFVTVSENFEIDIADQIVAAQTSALRRRFFTLSAFYTRLAEKRVCQQTDLLLTTSQEEANRFAELWPPVRSKISVIPSSIAASTYARHRDQRPAAESVVFSGDMSYFPNVAGTRYFFEQIYPLLKQARPSLVWSIVGRNCHPDILALVKKDPSIVVTGEVPDAAEYLAQSAVVVVPLLHGSGTRLKILEAWAVNRPVVSTSKGCEGMDCRHNHNIVIADTPAEFAAAVSRLLDDPDFAAAITQNATKTLLSLYDTPAVAHRLLAVLQQEPVAGTPLGPRRPLSAGGALE